MLGQGWPQGVFLINFSNSITCTHVSSIKTLMKVGCYKVLITLFTKGYFNFNKVLFSMFNRKAKYLKSL